jgi:hypothetical protein
VMAQMVIDNRGRGEMNTSLAAARTYRSVQTATVPCHTCLAGVAFKEGLCYSKWEAAGLFGALPLLVGGRLLQLFPDQVGASFASGPAFGVWEDTR